MHQISADEFSIVQCNDPAWFTRFPAAYGKSHFFISDIHDPTVGNIFRGSVQDIRKTGQINFHVSRVRFDRMVSKTAKGNHFPVRIQIFVHNNEKKKSFHGRWAIKKSTKFKYVVVEFKNP